MSTAYRISSDIPPTTLATRPSASFVETTDVLELKERALGYLRAGMPVHFRGPAGSGKTTLAMHVAAQIGRPVMFLAGDEELTTSHLIGGEFGYQYRKVVDRFIHSVMKYEEDATRRWLDHRLTTACREGHTLVYDEFTRSRAEANNILLGVLEERMLVLPTPNKSESYIKVHPEFRAIFTSNPQEYAGVHETPNALNDRMIMIDVDYFDRASELAITMARSNLREAEATKIVDLVRSYRSCGNFDQPPSLRASIMIGRVVAARNLTISSDDGRFVQACLDVLGARAGFSSATRAEAQQRREVLLHLIAETCPRAPDWKDALAVVDTWSSAAHPDVQTTSDHDDLGLNQSKIMNVIDANNLERDAQISLRNLRELDCAGKPLPAFSHPALVAFELEIDLGASAPASRN
jgi:gas vesicle protein GvpN